MWSFILYALNDFHFYVLLSCTSINDTKLLFFFQACSLCHESSSFSVAYIFSSKSIYKEFLYVHVMLYNIMMIHFVVLYDHLTYCFFLLKYYTCRLKGSLHEHDPVIEEEN